MSIKLLAMGNVLMEDDGIAVYLASLLEEELNKAGIDIIYGETDVGYCLMKINDGDFVVIMDASRVGKVPGTITLQTIDNINRGEYNFFQHNISILNMIKLYFPENNVLLLTVEIAEAGFHYGPSRQMLDKMNDISKVILEQIKYIKYNMAE